MPSAPKPKFFASPADFRSWLVAHHELETELLVGFYKVASGKPSMTWSQSVDEALCFGWIDAVRRSLGEEAYSIRFTRRKPKSIWSTINVAKVQQLMAEGKMHAAGERAFAQRSAERTGVYSFERAEAATLKAAELRDFKRDKQGWKFFDAQAPWYMRTALHWVVSAKRAETRARRLRTLIEDSAAGRRLAHLTPAQSQAKTKSAQPASRKRSGPRPSRSSMGKKQSGYNNKNKLGAHHIGSKSPRSAQKVTACKPEHTVRVSDMSASGCHSALPRE